MVRVPEFDENTVGIEDGNLDEEEVYLSDGRRLTEDLAEQLTTETLAKVRRRNLVPGGKSLQGDGSTSPAISVRLGKDLDARARDRAETEGTGVSKLIRKAVEQYLDAG